VTEFEMKKGRKYDQTYWRRGMVVENKGGIFF
jgi:hypothetical protein